MYTLLFLISLLLPNSSFAIPAQPIQPLGPITTINDTLNAILGPDWDPRFEVRTVYEEVPIDQDQSLVEAVQVLWELVQRPPDDQIWRQAYTDPQLPNIVITAVGPGAGRSIPVRCLTGGRYLGMQDMIKSRKFKKALFIIRWDGRWVGSIRIGKPGSSLSVPGDNSTNDARQKSSPNTLALVASQVLDRDSFSLSVPGTLSAQVKVKLDNLILGQPLPKYDAIMALMTVVFSASPPSARERMPYPGVQVMAPPPFEARLQVRPDRAVSERPFVTLRVVALAASQVPAILLLQARQWAEVKFQIKIDDVLVATCWLTKDGVGLGQSIVA